LVEALYGGFEFLRFRLAKLMERDVSLFGLTMKLKYWIVSLGFLAVGILGFLTIMLFTPLVYLIGASIGVIGVLISVISAVYGATSRQVEAFKTEFKEFGEEIVNELKSVRATLREILKALSK
jgi:Flp pilus assembly protein TadB